MNEEIRTIQVMGYFDLDGNPTCCSDWEHGAMCRFLTTRNYGSVEFCVATNEVIQRGVNLWLRPVPGCPVWDE